MALQIRQTLRQTQQLVMTPQLQQAIKLLQYNHLEMVDVLEHELKENPVLEVASEQESLTDEPSPERNDLEALQESVKEPENPMEEVFDPEWQNYLESYGVDRAQVSRDDMTPPPLENLAIKQETLFNHLLEQLRFSSIEDGDRRIAVEIIGNIDEDGYLDYDIAEMAAALDRTEDDVLDVLGLIQEFDPIGVAARDVRECLIIQARLLDPPNPLVLRILEETFGFFELGKLDKIARKLKVPLGGIEEASREIVRLDPKPGARFLNRDVRYVSPDIYVYRVGNEYSIVLNDDGLPRLRISSFYKTQLHGEASQSGAKSYIQEKMRGAMWLMKSIHQRQRTIYKVTESILKFQREFFDKGIAYLKPLVLKDVAMDVDMHESTISRVTSNKYMHTPRGIFELKYFFNTGIQYGMESIASESVKDKIMHIIKAEDPTRPISDKKIVEELSKQQIRIARRTVAKYRELMGIPPSSKRRKKF